MTFQNVIIENFIKAINKVDERDYKIAKVELVNSQLNIYEDRFSTYENNFVTKLNEKYALLMSINEIQEPKELVRQFQIPKKLVYGEHFDQRLQDEINKITDYLGNNSNLIEELEIIPDFIIHKDQDDLNSYNQRLIAEVKTSAGLSFKKFIWDFFKLNIYLDRLHFQNAIFLSVNISSTVITRYLKKYLSNEFYLTEQTQKLYILTKENFNAETQSTNLTDFMRK